MLGDSGTAVGPALRAATRDADPAVRRHAIGALAVARDAGAGPTLARCLSDAVDEVRAAARDPHPEVRARAADGLRRLSSEPTTG